MSDMRIAKDVLKEIKKEDLIKQAYDLQFQIRMKHVCRACYAYRIAAMILGIVGMGCITYLTYTIEIVMKRDGIAFAIACSAITGIIAYVFGRRDKLMERSNGK